MNKIKILRTGSSGSRNSSSQMSGNADKKIKISLKNIGKIKIRNKSEDEKSPLDIPQRPVTDLKLEGHGATRKLLKCKISNALNKN